MNLMQTALSIFIWTWFINHVTCIGDPPLDCNYVAHPKYEIRYVDDNGITHITTISDGWVRPIGFCFAKDEFRFSQTYSLKFECINNEVVVLVWFADTCDDSVPHEHNDTVSSTDFECDATQCDTVGIEHYILTADQCPNNTVPDDESPTLIPYIVDTCLPVGGGSQFVSDCDSSGNVIFAHYDTDNCTGALNEPPSATIPSTGGTCDEGVLRENTCSLAPDTTETMTTFGDTDSYSDDDSSDSREDVFYAAAINGDGLLQLELEDKEKHAADGAIHYTMNVEVSDAALRNVYGLFGVLMFANMLFCFLCHRRKTVPQLHAEEDTLP